MSIDGNVEYLTDEQISGDHTRVCGFEGFHGDASTVGNTQEGVAVLNGSGVCCERASSNEWDCEQQTYYQGTADK